ncbi:MAG: DoxX family membrane protein [Sporichthyaceae bacterium]|nr:DoxX family membrane protein [Sporichthyaceae bacterium]
MTTTGIGVGGRFATVQPWLSLAARLLLAGVLGVAGTLKLADPAAAIRAVSAYELVPSGLIELVGYGLPAAELGLALLLLIGLGIRFAAIASAVLLIAFILGIASAWARGLSIDCGCFGGGGEVAAGATRYLEEILRDVGLLIAAVWLAIFPKSPFALDRTD